MSLAFRTEYFDDKKGVVAFGTVSGAQVVSNTLTLNIKEGNLTIMPEFRFDTSTSDLFLNEGGKSTGTNGLFILATTYNF